MTPTTTDTPAILPENRRVQGSSAFYGHKSISMLRPVCNICQSGGNVNPRWMLSCTHDPYMSVVEEHWNEAQYSDDVDDKGLPTGTRTLTGTITKSRPIARPNWVEISVSDRINGGMGEAFARQKGYIRPSELRDGLFPNGIAECCEWASCRWQQGLVHYRDGWFCREHEARLAVIDARGTTGGKHNLEIGHDDRSREIQAAQIAGVTVEKVP